MGSLDCLAVATTRPPTARIEFSPPTKLHSRQDVRSRFGYAAALP
ncbi:hypothetical protein HEP73_00003 [Xanthomonas sp. GW]|nr:hypothetical protein HEP73_00003 [Xanthomonas sp. GW]